MEKIKFQRMNKDSGKVEDVEIYDSIAPYRLDDESREDYKIRRSIIKYLEKRKRKQKNLFHVSAELIPLKNENGEVILFQGNPMWVGKTKGKTYNKINNG